MYARLGGLHDEVRDAARDALEIAEYYGIPVQVTSTSRSYAEQTRLYQRYTECRRRGLVGRTRACAYPANPPGDSAHQFGLAFDSTVSPQFQPYWDWIRRYIGFHVPDNDVIHAEVPGWREFAPRHR